MLTRYELQWHVGYSQAPEAAPAELVPAVVPGAVQLELGTGARVGVSELRR